LISGLNFGDAECRRTNWVFGELFIELKYSIKGLFLAEQKRNQNFTATCEVPASVSLCPDGCRATGGRIVLRK